MLIPMKEMMKTATTQDRVLGAFHALNLEQAQGVIQASVELMSPVIICLSEPAALHAGLGAFHAMVAELAAEVPARISLLFDQVSEPDLVAAALEKGYDGVLAHVRQEDHDRTFSALAEIKALCEQAGAFLEVSVNLKDGEGGLGLKNLPRLLDQLQPDSICGIIPRDERSRPRDNLFTAIQQLKKTAGRPVSLAGIGRWPTPEIEKILTLKPWKLSVATRINIAFTKGLKSYGDFHPDRVSPRAYLAAAREALRDEVIACLRLFAGA